VTLRITDTEMTSDATRHRAELLPDGGWRVSWLPERRLTRDQAVTAMTLAEAVANMQEEGRTTVVDHTHRLWPHIDGWAAELGLTGPDAVVRASSSPEPAAIVHPSWCDLAFCKAHLPYGWHWSAPRRVEAGGIGGPLFEVSLFQPMWEPLSEAASVELRLTTTHHGGRLHSLETYETDPGQMRALAAVLVEVADQVDASRPAAPGRR
jgi:hypothetical protein